MTTPDQLTTKGTRTRDHLYTTALALFQEKGYEQTTMRDIATAAECSLGLAYRYFASKEAFVLELYRQLAVEMESTVQRLEGGAIADRFAQTMRLKFDQLTPYRSLFASSIGLIMTPRSDISVLNERSAAIRGHALASFGGIVEQADDRPRPPQANDMASLLYAAHLGLILCWLYDPTPEQRATHELLRVVRDLLLLSRRFLPLPPVASLSRRLAGALRPILGIEQG